MSDFLQKFTDHLKSPEGQAEIQKVMDDEKAIVQSKIDFFETEKFKQTINEIKADLSKPTPTRTRRMVADTDYIYGDYKTSEEDFFNMFNSVVETQLEFDDDGESGFDCEVYYYDGLKFTVHFGQGGRFSIEPFEGRTPTFTQCLKIGQMNIRMTTVDTDRLTIDINGKQFKYSVL
jgi:hypothetical protein